MNPEVTFLRKQKPNLNARGNVTYHRHDGPTITMKNGRLRTPDKEKIQYILNSDLIGRGIFEMATPPEIVDKWLRDETPDRLTEDILSTVNEKGLVELAKIYNLKQRQHGNHASIIKSMLKGKLVNNAVMMVLGKHKGDGVTDWLQVAIDAGIIYRNSPWYKFKIGDEKSDKDLSIGKTEVKAQQYALDHKDEIEKRAKNVS